MRNENPSKIKDYNPPENHSGSVYVRVGKEDGVPLWELRKPTPDERIPIVSNYIRMHGKEGPIKISFFSKKLCVSDRTIQGIIRLLEGEGAITIAPIFNASGRQQGNLYGWTGNVDPVIGSPTMEMLYARYDSYGFRSFRKVDGIPELHLVGICPLPGSGLAFLRIIIGTAPGIQPDRLQLLLPCILHLKSPSYGFGQAPMPEGLVLQASLPCPLVQLEGFSTFKTVFGD